jgi:hypothetical protein
MGRAHLGLKRYAEAVPLLERALTIRKAIHVDPYVPAETAFLLAQALWETRRDPDRALRLAEAAREGYAGSESYRRREAAAVGGWVEGRSQR